MGSSQANLGGLNLGETGHIALALAIGLLVGIQRGWVLRDAPAGTRFAGIRTFGLIGMAGGIAGALFSQAQGPATVLLGATAALVLVGYYKGTRPENVSGTGSIAGLLTLASGFLTGSGQPILGCAVAVAMVLLLTMRSRLHGWVRGLNEPEVLAIARFALIALVIWPLLPDRGYGPFEAWNPRQLWLVVVLVLGFSFLGYFASKLLGAGRGTLATAAAGSVVSSTAVTVALAAQMRENPATGASVKAATCVASVVMILRVMALSALLAPYVLQPLSLLAAPALLASAVPAAWHMRRMGPKDAGPPDEMRLRNPFDLGPALLLTALVMATTVAARWVLARYGDAGVALVLAISGSVDVDSAIITMGALPPGTLHPHVAALVLTAPIVLNTLFKAGLAISIAGWRQGRGMALPLVATALAMTAAAAISWSQ